MDAKLGGEVTEGGAVITPATQAAVQQAAALLRQGGSSRSRPRPSTASAPTPRTGARWRRCSRREPAALQSADRSRRRSRRRGGHRACHARRAPARAGLLAGAADPGAGAQGGTRLADLVTAGLSTVALRVPDHAVARALIAAAGVPLAAPSANRSPRQPDAGRARRCRPRRRSGDDPRRGPTRHGLESTVLEATSADVALLRPGAITVELIEAVLGRALRRDEAERPTARPAREAITPRRAPASRRLEVRPGEALLAFGPNSPPASAPFST